MDSHNGVRLDLQRPAPREQIRDGTDPLSMIVSGGGGVGGGAIGGYVLSRILNNGKNGTNDVSDIKCELTGIAHRLDNTNELLNELLRSQARLEGILASK